MVRRWVGLRLGGCTLSSASTVTRTWLGLGLRLGLGLGLGLGLRLGLGFETTWPTPLPGSVLIPPVYWRRG